MRFPGEPQFDHDRARRSIVGFEILAKLRARRAHITATRGVVMPKERHAIAGLEDVLADAPTLGELVAGMAAGRSSPEQRSCFLNLTGIGLQFAAAGAALYCKARAAGAGRELPGEWFTEDVLP